MQRLRIKGRALYSDKFVAYIFGGINWDHILLDFNLDADNTPYTQDIEINVAVSSTTTIKIGSCEFIYPLPIKHTTIVDGVLRGFVKVKFECASGTAYLEKIMAMLKAIDSEGNKREIEKYGIATDLNATTSVTKSIPFFFDISSEKKDADGNVISELKYNERILLEIALYGKVSAGTGKYYLSCEINKDDIYVDIPIV